MADHLQETKRVQFLLLNLILLLVGVMALILMIGAYRQFLAPEPTPTPTITLTPRPSQTPILTGSPTPTATASNTPRPSLTPIMSNTPFFTLSPTSSATLPGPPTLTPARPVPQSARYGLRDWTAADADYAIRLMEDYPNTLPLDARGEDNQAYYAAFRFSALAQKEALLRFPDSGYARGWEWGLAFNLARMADYKAGDHYRDLIVKGLNNGETDLSNLYIWFNTQEPRLDLYMLNLSAPAGYIGSYLLEIRGEGGAFIWLLETDQAYRAYTLVSQFDYVNSTQASWVVANLDGVTANGDEIAIYFSTPESKKDLDPPRIFSLDQIPPRELPFIPEHSIFNLGMDYKNYWAIVPDHQAGKDLLFRSTVFPACAVTIERQYHWDGNNFVLVRSSYSVADNPITLAYCDLAAKHAANTWGSEAVIAIMEPLLDLWPPEKTIEGLAYSPEAYDEWRYRLAIAYALNGQRDQALELFEAIIDSPAVPRSNWIQPAIDFQNNYKGEQDLYQACVLTTFCQPAQALDRLLRASEDALDIIAYLRDSDVKLTGSGYFDFDQDGETERWISVQHRPREKPEFWILALYRDGLKGLRVTQVETNPPAFEILDEAFIAEQDLHLQPAIFIDGKFAFHMERMPETQFPFLTPVSLRQEYPDRYLSALETIEQAFFAGETPKQTQKDLQALAVYPGLLCVNTWSCDSYYYLLGLASELAGDERAAVDAYHRLWSDYSRSPYTTLARLKLSGGVLLTSTPTLTPTATLTLTPTITLTPTPTVTGTPPTSTPTPTLTYTPDPNATPTPTITSTETLTPTISPTISVTSYP